MDTVYSKDSDDKFNSINGMIWLPWIGKDYFMEPESLSMLIVGESHYIKTNDKISTTIEQQRQSQLTVRMRPEYTREIVDECPVCHEWTNRSLMNISKTIVGSESVNDQLFWRKIAFYNFIQRLMDYDRKERPDGNDYKLAWEVFSNVVKILRPRVCVFLGVQSSGSFDWNMKRLGLNYEPVRTGLKVGRVKLRHATIVIDGITVPLMFIKHTGMRFDYVRWHDVLVKESPQLREILDHCNSSLHHSIR